MTMNCFQHLLMSSLWVVVIMLAVLENGCNGCLEKERIALLQLKHSINFPNRHWLPSWEEDDSMDCCHWERVECNSTTRRVIKLELNYTRELWNGDWDLNASILLPFESLRSLDLSGNGLRSFVGNEGTGILSNLTNLEELDLSKNNLGNGILPSLNKLSNLKFLRLAQINLNGPIYVKGIGILSNLTNLEELDLSDNNLGNGILPSLNKLSNLKFLHLDANNLNGSIYVKEFDGLNNLKELDLSYNTIASISALNGSQEESGILKKLEVLDLSRNEALNNSVWSFLGGLSSIKTVDLSFNKGLHGAVHNKDLRNISNIETLLMDVVMLDDVLPYIRVMTSLQVLSLISCDSKRISSIEGLGILSNLSNLESIDLRYNGLDNSILPSLNKLSNLKILNLAGNALNASIFIKEFDGLSNLKELDLSKNAIANIRALNSSQEESGRLNKLEVLYLSSNFLDDTIWLCLRELSSIKTLDLSGNHGLHGAVPNLKNLSSIENLFMNDVMLDDDFLPKIRVMTSIPVLSLRDCELTRVLPMKG